MKRPRSRKARITAVLGLIVLSFGIVYFLLRGPYLSNSIKRMIIPALENVTRESIIIDKAVINLFPFYVQAKGFKLFDKDGNRLLWITKTRAYIDLLGLLSNEIRIRKLTLLEPDLSASEQDVARMIENVQQSADIGEKGKFRVVIKNIKMTDGNLIYKDSVRGIGIAGNGLFLDTVSKNLFSTISVSLKSSTVTLPNGAELEAVINGKIKTEKESVEIVKANIDSSGSTLAMSGTLRFSPENDIVGGMITGKAHILPEVFGRVFDVAADKDGSVALEGAVHLSVDEQSRRLNYTLDLKTDSHFYLETLMEILDVNENIKGKVSFKGIISGTYPDITGSGTATLENAVLDTLPISSLKGEMRYEDGTFALGDFTAHAFNGIMTGDAHILVPEGDYAVEGEMSNLFSPEFFQFIRWKPPLPDGTVNGRFHVMHSAGEKIRVEANARYVNRTNADGDVLSRLKTASTSLSLKDSILILNDAEFQTDKSALFLNGRIDLDHQHMDLDLDLRSGDISDLSAPFYEELTAPARFSGKAVGPVSDPVLSGELKCDAGRVQGFPFSDMSAALKYSIRQLSIDSLRMNRDQAQYDVFGTIDFRKSESLFSFLDPYFSLNAVVSKVPIRQIITAFYREVPVNGIMNGTAECTGGQGDFACTAKLALTGNTVYDHVIESADVHVVVDREKVHFKDIAMHQAGSSLSGSGVIFFDKNYDIKFSSDRIQLHDIHALGEYPLDAVFGLNISGSGSLDKPSADFSLDIHESSVKGQQAGRGAIKGVIDGEKLEADGTLADGRIRVSFQTEFPRFETWSLKAEFEEARYDFLLTGFLKGVPENFSIYGKGIVGVSSRDGTLSASSRFSALNVNMYDYVLKNRDEIIVDLNNSEIAIRSFIFGGENSELSVSGLFTPGERYDLSVKGSIHLAPLRAITDKFASLDGMGSMDATVKGEWKRPEITGEVTLANAVIVLADQAQKVGPVNGTFLLRNDRVSFDSVSAGFAGGTLLMSGMAHINNFSIDKLFLSSTMDGIAIKPSDGITADIGGRAFYEYSPRGAALSGTIAVNRARYEKKFDWRGWLLGLGQANGNNTRYPEFMKKTKLNLQITGSDNIIIDNNIVTAPVIIRVNIVGTVERYGLVGRVESKEGQVFFRGNEFRIVEGSSMDFLDPDRIYPLLHIMAETYKLDYHVKLSIDGGLDNLGVTFFSDPPLPESDIISLLTFGHTGKGSKKGLGGGIAAGEATAMLTGGIQDEIEEELKGITGFERIKFEPHTTSTGAFTSKVTVGKSLLEDRVSVTYSTAIGTTEEQIVRVEYKLSDEVSVVGSRDEYGITGADLKYKLEFK